MKIGVFIAILAIVIVASVIFIQRAGYNVKECNVDTDCIAATCCHASACVAKDKAPNCSGIMCTEECQANTMDCGQGSCKCENHACLAKITNIVQ